MISVRPNTVQNGIEFIEMDSIFVMVLDVWYSSFLNGHENLQENFEEISEIPVFFFFRSEYEMSICLRQMNNRMKMRISF